MKHLLLGLLMVSLLGAAFAAKPAPAQPKAKAAPVIQAVSLQGTIQSIRISHGLFDGSTASAVLATEHGQYRLVIGPKSYLKKSGLMLKKGETISVNGWQREGKAKVAKVTVRDLTVDGKTYAFRGEDMKPLWEKPKAQETPRAHTMTSHQAK